MSKILLLNFDSNSNFIDNCNIAANYLTYNSFSEINILTFAENEQFANLYTNLFKFTYIDKDRIQKIYSSRLFNDSFAIKGFINDIQPILDFQWDKTIDLTKNNFSSYLHSAVQSKHKTGLTFDSRKFVNYSDKFIQIYNDFILSSPDSLLNKSIVNHSQLNLFNSTFIDYKISEEITTISNRNFARIRNKIGQEVHLIGVTINNKSNFQSTCEIINKYITSFDSYPVLIYKASKETADLIDKINKVFENSLICIRYEYNALPAILRNLDLVITNDKIVSKIAEGTETPNIFITNKLNSNLSLNSSTFLLQENLRTKINDDIFIFSNYILTNIDNLSEIENEYAFANLETEGISFSFRFQEGTYNFKSLLTFKNITDFFEITHRLKLNTDLDWDPRFIHSEKENISTAVKAILNTLRILKGGLNNNIEVNKFINSLDDIFSLSEQNTSIRPMLLKFKSCVERIHEQDPSTNIKNIENYLFDLKDDLKRIIRELPNTERFKESSL